MLGFIGIGHMGRALAERLLADGMTLWVYDIRPEALAGLERRGASVASGPRELADMAEVVVTCLPTAEAAQAVAKAMVGARAIRTVVETSTLGVAAIRQLFEKYAENGIAFVDAPVSGGPAGARAGSLTMIVAGRAAGIETARSVIDSLGDRQFVVGSEPGQAQVCKLVNNAIGITGAVIAYEAIVMGVRSGIDPVTLVDIVNSGTGRNSTTANRFPKSILPGKFNVFAPLGMASKDIDLYVEQAHSLGISAPVGEEVSRLWRLALNDPRVEGDGSSMIRMFEGWAGVEVRAGRGKDGRNRT